MTAAALEVVWSMVRLSRKDLAMGRLGISQLLIGSMTVKALLAVTMQS